MEKKKSKYARGKNPNSLKALKEGRNSWKPGQSGNPAGRQKGIKYISEALRELLDPATADKLAKELIKRAGESDSAITIVFERTEGKVTQPIGIDPTMPIVVDKIVAHVTEGNNGSNNNPSKSES